MTHICFLLTFFFFSKNKAVLLYMDVQSYIKSWVIQGIINNLWWILVFQLKIQQIL